MSRPPPPPREAPAILATPQAAVDTGLLTRDAAARSENHPAPVAAAAAAPSGPVASVSAAPAGERFGEGVREYRLALAVQAKRYKRYPPRAMEAGIGGTAEVRISVAAAGRAAEILLSSSSGDETLDAAALEMMKRAAPRTAVPESLRDRSFAVDLPIIFDPATD